MNFSCCSRPYIRVHRLGHLELYRHRTWLCLNLSLQGWLLRVVLGDGHVPSEVGQNPGDIKVVKIELYRPQECVSLVELVVGLVCLVKVQANDADENDEKACQCPLRHDVSGIVVPQENHQDAQWNKQKNLAAKLPGLLCHDRSRCVESWYDPKYPCLLGWKNDFVFLIHTLQELIGKKSPIIYKYIY